MNKSTRTGRIVLGIGLLLMCLLLAAVTGFAEEATQAPEGTPEEQVQQEETTAPESTDIPEEEPTAPADNVPLGDDVDVMYVLNPQPTNRLNLRAQADVASESLGKYYTGTVVEVLGESGDFIQVRVADQIGFMQKEFLTETRQDLELGLWGTISVPGNGQKLHLRAQAIDEAVSLGLYENGTVVQILEELDEYYKVRMLERDGFMRKEFLQLDGAPGKQDLTVLTAAMLENDVMLYAFPSVEAPILAIRGKGELVKILATTGTWYYVEIGNEDMLAVDRQRGFMLGQYLKVSDYVQGKAASPYTYAVVKNADEHIKLVLRAQAAWSSEEMGMFLNAAQVEVMDNVSAKGLLPLWVHVRIGGLEGYMQGEFLSVIDPSDPSGWAVEDLVPLPDPTPTPVPSASPGATGTGTDTTEGSDSGAFIIEEHG